MANIVKGKIGNALMSVAPDGIVATADAIYDETKGKSQEQINEDTKQSLAEQVSNIGYYECGTAAATAAKEITGGGYKLPDAAPYGGTLKVKFTYKNSAANPTLSINRSPAKPLYYNGAIASSTNTWEDGDVLDLYYDGTNFNARSVVEKFATGEKVKNVGIDSEPTAGSDNLVKSSGVNARISENVVEGVLHFNGKGNTGVFEKFYLHIGKFYRFYLSSTTWDTTGLSVAIFSIQRKLPGESSYSAVIAVMPGDTVQPYYDVVAEDTTDYLIGFRGAVGSELSVNIKELGIVNEPNIITDNIGESDLLYKYDYNGSVYRYYAVFKREISQLQTFSFNTDFTNTLINSSIGSFDTLNKALDASSYPSIEGSGFSKLPKTFTFNNQNSRYVVFVFKRDDNAAFSSEELSLILQSQFGYNVGGKIISESYNNEISPKTDLKSIVQNGEFIMNKVPLMTNSDLFVKLGVCSSYRYNGIRLYCPIDEVLSVGDKITIESELIPSGYEIAFSCFDTWQKALNAGTSETTETGGWGGYTYTITNPLSKYLVITIKYGSNADIPVNAESLFYDIVTKILRKQTQLKDAYGNVKNPTTESKLVSYKDTNVEKVLDDLDATYLKVDEASINDFAFKLVATDIRARYTTELKYAPKTVTVNNVENLPSTFWISLSTNYSLSDAQSTTIPAVQASGWNDYPYTFTDTTVRFLTVNIRKEDNTAFTAEDIALIESLGITVKISYLNLGIIPQSESQGIVELNDEVKTKRYLKNLTLPNYSMDGNYTPGILPFVLLHCSDIHADEINLKRIVDYKTYYSQYIDDAICTGDLIKDEFSNSHDFWDNAGAQNMLITTGNHEYYLRTDPHYYTQVTPLQVYNKFFKDYIQYWGTVHFPTNADTEGYNYYYKDYPSKHIRLIMLDSMANMNANRDNIQATWLTSVLNDVLDENSAAYGYHVICALHLGSTIETLFDTSFSSYKNLLNRDNSGVNATVFAEFYTLRDAVESFITSGGTFVGWIAGHRHVDGVGLLTGYHQALFNVATASGVTDTSWYIIPRGDDCDRTSGVKQQDSFNLYSIDTEKKLLRIFKVGSDMDKNGRHKESLVYDYNSCQVLYSD